MSLGFAQKKKKKKGHFKMPFVANSVEFQAPSGRHVGSQEGINGVSLL